MIIREDQIANSKCRTAYWVAFGPHGPRALPPPDEGKKVTLYVVIALFASLTIFSAMRMFAKPPPHTMTREWQEAANEYLKVRIRQTPSFRRDTGSARTHVLTLRHQNRSKNPTQSRVSPPPTTLARARSSPPPRKLKRLRQQQMETLLFVGRKSRSNIIIFPRGFSPMCKVISREIIGPGERLDGDCDYVRGCRTLYENHKNTATSTKARIRNVTVSTNTVVVIQNAAREAS